VIGEIGTGTAVPMDPEERKVLGAAARLATRTGLLTVTHVSGDRAQCALDQVDVFDVPSLSSYSVSRCPPGLVFGYVAFDPQELRTHIVSLARTLDRERVPTAGSEPSLRRSPPRLDNSLRFLRCGEHSEERSD
jgi:hypothetical protein